MKEVRKCANNRCSPCKFHIFSKNCMANLFAPPTSAA